MELELAVICASIPVFWPVLHDLGFKVFITNEVKVVSESRLGGGSEENIMEHAFDTTMPATTANVPSTTYQRTGKVSLERIISNLSKDGSDGSLHAKNSHEDVKGGNYTTFGLYDDSKNDIQMEDIDMRYPPRKGSKVPGFQVTVVTNKGEAEYKHQGL